MPLDLPVRFTLLDYFALQAWTVRPRVGQSLAIFTCALFVGVVAVPLGMGASLKYIGFDIFYRRTFYAELFFGCLILTLGLPFLMVVYYWVSGNFSRRGRFSASTQGLKFIAEDMELASDWSRIEWALETRAAFVVKFKKLVFRIPRRELSAAQQAEFKTLVRAHVPAAADRLGR